MKIHRTKYGILTVLALGLGFLGCDSQGLSLFTRGPGTNLPDNTTEIPPVPEIPNPPGVGEPGEPVTRLLDEWNQPVGSTRPVDLIFVQDTSGSLDEEREAVMAALSGFLNTLEDRGITDYCIGVMLAHQGSRSGALYSGSSVNDLCLCSDEYSKSGLRAAFEGNFRNPPEESASDGGEAMLYSFYKSFTDVSKLSAIEQAGCYRLNAALVPIFVSDENDVSTSPNQTCSGVSYTFDPVGPATVQDPNCNEVKARKNLHSDSSGKLILGEEEIFDEARSFMGVLPLLSATVGYVGDTYPVGGENEYPYGMAEFSIRTGGDLVDLKLATDGDQAGFNSAFNNLASAVADKVKLQTVFDLTSRACTGTVRVSVDGENVSSFSVVNDGKRVILSAGDAGGEGSLIEISYNVCK